MNFLHMYIGYRYMLHASLFKSTHLKLYDRLGSNDTLMTFSLNKTRETIYILFDFLTC